RILDVLDVDEELPSRVGANRLTAQTRGGAISIRNVSFHYPGTETPVLHNVTFEIEAGQTVALVGRSGAGKTTHTNLVARFYDPTSGEILYNGVDLRDIQLSSYRALLGIVEQDVF